MEGVGMEVYGCQFLIRDLHFRRVILGVQVRPHLQPRLRGRRSDQIDNDLIALQRAAPPILRNLREQAVFDLFHLLVPGGK